MTNSETRAASFYLHTINSVFFETPEIGIIDIFLLLKYENELELVTSDISFNSDNPGQVLICIRNNLAGNYFPSISIRSYIN